MLTQNTWCWWAGGVPWCHHFVGSNPHGRYHFVGVPIPFCRGIGWAPYRMELSSSRGEFQGGCKVIFFGGIVLEVEMFDGSWWLIFLAFLGGFWWMLRWKLKHMLAHFNDLWSVPETISFPETSLKGFKGQSCPNWPHRDESRCSCSAHCFFAHFLAGSPPRN
jgi:hypothetical protein